MNNSGTGSLGALVARALQQPLAVAVGIVVVSIIVGAIVGWWFLLVGLVAAGLVVYLAPRTAPGQGQAAAPLRPMQNAASLDLRKLEGKYLASMQRALATRQNIERAIGETGDPGVRSALSDATRDLEEMVSSIYNLAYKACSVQTSLQSSNNVLALADEIERLNTAINTTTDEFQKSQYYATLDGKLQQMQNLTDTTVAMQRWDAQLDNALSTLDTILSQVLRIKSSEALSYTAATDQLSHSLREEVDSLKATSDALDSVYGWSK
jgi:hypothetical protein